MSFSRDDEHAVWQAKTAAMTNDELTAANDELNVALRTIQSDCAKHNVPLMIPMSMSAACIAVVTEMRKRGIAQQ